jgi:hypothetical protein
MELLYPLVEGRHKIGGPEIAALFRGAKASAGIFVPMNPLPRAIMPLSRKHNVIPAGFNAWSD